MNKESKYKLSIITINYNNLDGLKRTVESVINQSWNEFEYIIIDGGSTDGSAQYIRENQEHFQYWVSETDKGIYNAMNKGIKVANGEYLLFLNSGDWLIRPLVHIKPFLTKDNVYYFKPTFDSGGNELNVGDYPKVLTKHFLLFRSLNHQNIVYPKKHIELYNEGYMYISDWILNVRLFLFKGVRFERVPRFLSAYDMYGVSSSLSDTGNQANEEKSKYLMKYFPIDYVLNNPFTVKRILRVIRNHYFLLCLYSF